MFLHPVINNEVLTPAGDMVVLLVWSEPNCEEMEPTAFSKSCHSSDRLPLDQCAPLSLKYKLTVLLDRSFDVDVLNQVGTQPIGVSTGEDLWLNTAGRWCRTWTRWVFLLFWDLHSCCSPFLWDPTSSLGDSGFSTVVAEVWDRSCTLSMRFHSVLKQTLPPELQSFHVKLHPQFREPVMIFSQLLQLSCHERGCSNRTCGCSSTKHHFSKNHAINNILNLRNYENTITENTKDCLVWVIFQSEKQRYGQKMYFIFV